MRRRIEHRVGCGAWALSLALSAAAFAQGRGDLPAVAPTNSNSSQTNVEPSIKLSISGLPDGFELKRSSTFAEGTIVTAVPGMLLKTGAGDFVFLPDEGTHVSDATLAPVAPAMVLLPCQRLAQIATSLQSRGDRARGTISGQLYSYRGRAFVLPTSVVYESASDVSKVEAGDQAAAKSDSAAAAKSDTATDTKTETKSDAKSDAKSKGEQTADATSDQKTSQRVVLPAGGSAGSGGGVSDGNGKISEVIRDFEAAWSTRRTISRPERVVNDANAEKTATGEAKPVTLVPERTLLSNVRGRLVRLAEASGRFAFAVDNDPNSPTAGVQVPGATVVGGSGASANIGATGPMLILPNRQLEMIEDAVSQMGENAAFSLTARVTEYKGERYVLPIAFRVLAVSDIKPAQ